MPVPDPDPDRGRTQSPAPFAIHKQQYVTAPSTAISPLSVPPNGVQLASTSGTHIPLSLIHISEPTRPY